MKFSCKSISQLEIKLVKFYKFDHFMGFMAITALATLPASTHVRKMVSLTMIENYLEKKPHLFL